MPAESKAQRKFFGMLEHNPGMAKEKGVHMTHGQMHDFAATKDKGLPEHKSSFAGKKAKSKLKASSY